MGAKVGNDATRGHTVRMVGNEKSSVETPGASAGCWVSTTPTRHWGKSKMENENGNFRS